MALSGKGDFRAATSELREAVRLDPKRARAHYHLGNSLRDGGDLDGAVKAFRETIRLEPGFAEAHCNLGLILMSQARFREAREAFRRGHDLGSRRPGWNYPSASWLAEAEGLARVEERFPAVLRGEETPAEAQQALILAAVAARDSLASAAARLYATAFELDPKLADKLDSPHLYNAASMAVLAGSGEGRDEARPDAPERTRLRNQALGWLRANLAAWDRVAKDARDPLRPQIGTFLDELKQSPQLARVRDPDGLAKLPDGERAAWKAFWDDLDALLKKAGPARK